MKIIDISKDVMTCEVFPGDPTPSLEKVKTIDDDCAYNLSKINMCLHNGTHMDAPLHFLPMVMMLQKLTLKYLWGLA